MVRLLLPALCVVLALGCSAPTVDLEVKGQTTVTGDPSPTPGQISSFPQVGSFTDIDFGQNQELKNQGISKDQIQSVKAKSIKVQISRPDTQDFSFLEQLALYARAGDTEQLVAQKTGIDQLGLKAPNPTLRLDPEDVELRPFLTAPKTSLTLRGKGHSPPQDTTLDVTVTLTVQPKVF